MYESLFIGCMRTASYTTPFENDIETNITYSMGLHSQRLHYGSTSKQIDTITQGNIGDGLQGSGNTIHLTRLRIVNNFLVVMWTWS